jgi:hypothetical protein
VYVFSQDRSGLEGMLLVSLWSSLTCKLLEVDDYF